MSKTDIKKGDEIIVISGREKGNRGKVLSYSRENDRLTIEGLNMVKRHLKNNSQGEGGIIKREAPMHRSNVMLASLWDERSAKKTIKPTES